MTENADLETGMTTAEPILHAGASHDAMPTRASSPETSFLDAAAAAAVAMACDVQSQKTSQLTLQPPDDFVPEEKSQAETFGVVSQGDEETASSFSVDSSQERKNKFYDILASKNVINNNNIFWNTDDDRVPFPSINESLEEYNKVVNVCPCRCFFFTLKETMCMVMSALGCAVFFTGLVFLCLFLEGSWFQNKQ